MYKHILQSVSGLNWFAIVPLLIFFITFCVVVLMIFKKDKAEAEAMARMPLDN